MTQQPKPPSKLDDAPSNDEAPDPKRPDSPEEADDVHGDPETPV
jgi:hypothetical protein